MAGPEPFWLDTNTISRVANGDVMLELELLSLKNAGFQFKYVPMVDQELFKGNLFRGKPASPDLFLRKRMAISRLGAELDESGDRLRALEFAERGFDLPRYMESDASILSQVAASAEDRGITSPKIFTCDIDVFKNAERWGVDAWTRSTPFTESPRLVITQPEPSRFNNSTAMGLMTASSAAQFADALAGASALQVAALQRISMEDAGSEAWEDWRASRKMLRDSLRKSPGLGYAVTFWFEYVPAFDINFPDEWTYLVMATELSTRPRTVRGAWALPGPRNPRAQYKNIDVWIPPLYPPVSPKPVARGGATGPGINYSPMMDPVETEVYLSLDGRTAKSMWQIANETGLPDADVGRALTMLQMKNMAAFWNRGEASGWIRTQ